MVKVTIDGVEVEVPKVQQFSMLPVKLEETLFLQRCVTIRV